MVVRVPTPPDRWKQVESLFYAALGHKPEMRARFLADSCGEDDELFVEVERLLVLHSTEDDFLEPPDGTDGCGGLLGTNGKDLRGQRIGRFRLVRPIARGGMGMVWLGERADNAFQQRVAVKLVNWGLATDERRRRFEKERQTLAQLEHPNITRLIDGGSTDDGLPYLVMEYVEGRRIDEYCDANQLSVRQRLELFRTLCDAVHYAHQNLVIHRDLKPNNILVTRDGQPKLLDFGISKLLADTPGVPSQDATLTLVRVLTPRYASPEQVRGETITTASDVYSLGVILYELLTGHRPYAVDPAATRDCERLICEQEPVAPSQVIDRTDEVVAHGGSTTTVTPESVSGLRGEHPRQLRRRLCGDLDNIVLKAMRKQTQRRYVSVQQFSEDIGRHLDGLPVIARGDTPLYRMSKFVKRNKTVVVACLSVVLSLLVGIAGTTMSLRRARSERDIAVRVNEFLQGVIGSTMTFGDMRDATVMEMLAEASARVDSQLGAEPAVEAATRTALARTYAELWQWSHVERHARIALAQHRALYGDNDPVVADCLVLLGRALTNLAKPAAIPILRRALELRTDRYEADHPLVAEITARLGEAMWRAVKPPRWSEAETLLQQSIQALREHPEAESFQLAAALLLHATMRWDQRVRDEQTRALYEEALALYAETPARDTRAAAACGARLSVLLCITGDFEREAEVLTSMIETAPPLQALDANVRRARWRVAVLQSESGNVAAATHAYRDALSSECAWRKHKCSLEAREWEALQLAVDANTRLADLPGLAEQVINQLPVCDCDDNLRLSARMVDIATFAFDNGHAMAARSLLDTTKDYQWRQFPNVEWLHAYTQSALGAILLAQRHFDEAKPLLVEGFRVVRATQGQRSERGQRTIRRLIALYEITDRALKADHYRQMLVQPDATDTTAGTR